MKITIQNFIGLINQLNIHLKRLPEMAYAEKMSLFDRATIGEHVRHIYNFPECLLKGMENGIINYDKRIRNPRIEVDREYAIILLLDQTKAILNLETNENIPLLLETGINESKISRMETNLKRELHYITEHTIHHMAILRVGMNFYFPEMEIESSFGFAFSTLEYKNIPIESSSS